MSGTLSINSLAFSLERTLPRVFQQLPRNSVHMSYSKHLWVFVSSFPSRPNLFQRFEYDRLQKDKDVAIFFFNTYFYVYGAHTCHSTYVTIKGPLSRLTSLLPCYGFWSSISIRDASWQAPLPAKLSLWTLYFNINNFMQNFI